MKKCPICKGEIKEIGYGNYKCLCGYEEFTAKQHIIHELKNKGIKAIYSDCGFVEIFINRKSEKIIGGEDLSDISDLLKLISDKFDINLVEENS